MLPSLELVIAVERRVLPSSRDCGVMVHCAGPEKEADPGPA